MASDDDVLDDEQESVDNTYLIFFVGGEEYAVSVAHVTEIVRLPRSFAVPDVPRYIRGVINLRGKVIPLLDVRSRFGLVEEPYTDRTVVVVIEVDDAVTGLVVDAVSEVAEISPHEIEPRSGMRTLGKPSMVKGMGKRASRVSFVLDVASLLQHGSDSSVSASTRA